jgi:hypothetical protein
MKRSISSMNRLRRLVHCRNGHPKPGDWNQETCRSVARRSATTTAPDVIKNYATSGSMEAFPDDLQVHGPPNRCGLS